jgi:hypothetical protein
MTNPITEAMVDELIEAAKCVGHYSTLRDSGEDTIQYWQDRTAEFRAKLLEAATAASPQTDAALIHDNLYDALGMLDKARALIEETRRLARTKAKIP